MRTLLFGAAVAAMMIVVSPALAERNEVGCTGCPRWRPDTTPSPPVYHLVREQIGTRHGQAVYRTRQVCG
jgi:hypothetical protein